MRFRGQRLCSRTNTRTAGDRWNNIQTERYNTIVSQNNTSLQSSVTYQSVSLYCYVRTQHTDWLDTACSRRTCGRTTLSDATVLHSDSVVLLWCDWGQRQCWYDLSEVALSSVTHQLKCCLDRQHQNPSCFVILKWFRYNWPMVFSATIFITFASVPYWHLLLYAANTQSFASVSSFQSLVFSQSQH